MNPEDFTPELIPATPEQTDELVVACNALLQHADRESHDGIYMKIFSMAEPPQPAIDSLFTDMPHQSEVVEREYDMTITLGHDEGVVARNVAGPSMRIQFRRLSKLSFEFWLPSEVSYEADAPEGGISRTVDYDILSVSQLHEGVRITQGKDTLLHGVLRTLLNVREQRLDLARDATRHVELMNQLQRDRLSEQQERVFGLRTASYAEVASVVHHVREVAE